MTEFACQPPSPVDITRREDGVILMRSKAAMPRVRQSLPNLFDEIATTYPDPDHSDREDREVTIGYSMRRRLLFVAQVLRNERIRLISARLATPKERRRHEQGLRE